MGYYEELLLGYLSLELLYSINDEEFILKNTEKNNVFKVNKQKYQNLLEEGREIHISIWKIQ